ncbi:hypothetical protein SAMN07250955_1241, partial [Arboricoccus pini]
PRRGSGAVAAWGRGDRSSPWGLPYKEYSLYTTGLMRHPLFDPPQPHGSRGLSAHRQQSCRSVLAQRDVDHQIAEGRRRLPPHARVIKQGVLRDRVSATPGIIRREPGSDARDSVAPRQGQGSGSQGLCICPNTRTATMRGNHDQAGQSPPLGVHGSRLSHLAARARNKGRVAGGTTAWTDSGAAFAAQRGLLTDGRQHGHGRQGKDLKIVLPSLAHGVRREEPGLIGACY